MTAESPAPLVSVVVLAFNEETNLRAAVGELLSELKSLGSDWELVIVDDGSTDATCAIAEEIAAAEPGVRVVHHGTNLGLGGGYRTGFREARGQWVTFFPADGQFPANIVGQFLRRSKGADMVVGYLPGLRPGIVGQTLSFAERVLYRVLFQKLPRFQGILLIHRRLLQEIPLVSEGRGWAIVMELLIRAARGPYTLVSEPTEIRPRMSGESKVNNVRTIVANLVQLWELNRKL
jgi:glycosyltransferase involved in cell wall biosynthesis